MTADRTDSPEPTVLRAEGRDCRIETVREALGERLRALTAPRRGVLLLDQAFRSEADRWADQLPGFRVLFTEAPGEAAKTFDEAQRILTVLAAEKLARDDWFLVRGGGSLTDLGAFCAGLYRRGMRLILAPTTLLGAVDAAVGGKTAVNFGGAKNQIGHFYLPEHVLVDLPAFATLGRERLAEGLVEAYKTGLLFDPRLVDLVEGRLEALLAGDPDLLAEVVRRSYAAKAALVARDYREEKGLRDVLNLGHTFGHVVESFLAPNLSHGRAVALGLAVAAELSRTLGGLPGESAARIIRTAERLGGPWPALPPDETALELLAADKKIRQGRLRFVILEGDGRPRLIETEAPDLLAAARRLVGPGA